MGKERFLRELGPSPETAKTSDTEIEETMGEENKGKSANAEEATEPMGDAKLKAKIKAEVLEELNLQQQLSNFSQQINSDGKADLDSLEAKINKAIDEAIKNVIASHGHSSSDVVKAVKAELKAEAEAERQKGEAEKPKGMLWPLSILNK